MAKLILNPAYEIRAGKPTCDHERTVIQLGDEIYEFCDECMTVWIRRRNDDEEA